MDVAIHCRYAEDINLDFPKEIMALPGGEGLSKCIQCGTCSAGCPLSVYMDYTPRRIISLTRSGLEKDVLKAFTPWLCASCYECQVLCPKEIKITDIMYALKRRAIKKGSYPKRFPVPVLAREFFNMVFKNGRNSETWVVMKLMMKTNPFKLLGMAPQGLKLMKAGRMPLGQEKIKDRRQLQKMLDRVGEA
jgi:quinone-modifying oxidoreductase subunit QmoC